MNNFTVKQILPPELLKVMGPTHHELKQMRQAQIDLVVEHLLMGVPFFEGGKA
jgi:hypothetical protein